MWCLSFDLRGRNQPSEPEGLMREGFRGGGWQCRGPGVEEVGVQGRGLPSWVTLCPHGRNWQLPSVPSARPSRSGMSWPTRLLTAAAKGE